MLETEIRAVMVKQFEVLPTEYLNTPQAMSKVLAEIVGRGGGAAREADSPYHVIQKHLILILGGAGGCDGWLGHQAYRPTPAQAVQPPRPHQQGAGGPGGGDIILQTYTEYLMGQTSWASSPGTWPGSPSRTSCHSSQLS
jgi:hypothetical protein